MADFTVRQGDNFTIADTLEDADGVPVSIQGAAIKLTLIPIGGGTALLQDVAATNLQVGDGSDGTRGKVSYSGGGATTATPGLYLGSWLNSTTSQTFPNGGYILFEVTADTPVSSVTRFATSSDLEVRLGLEFTVEEHVRAAKLLADASKLIQDETGQTISLVTADTLIRRSVYDDRFRLPQRPVVSVASVVLDGVTVDPTSWYVEGDEVVQAGIAEQFFAAVSRGWGGPLRTLTVVYTHGYTTVPGLARSVCMEAVARVWVNPGAVVQESIAGVVTTYAPYSSPPRGLLLTDDEKASLNNLLRRQSGSVSLR